MPRLQQTLFKHSFFVGSAQSGARWGEAAVAASWDPFTDGFRLLERFGGRFANESGIGDMFSDGFFGDDHDATTPAANVWDDAEGRNFEVELPGVPASRVQVLIEGDELVVDADRPLTIAGQRRIHSLEGVHGKMRRRFPLPPGAETERAQVELRSGVLRIHLPREVRTTTTRKLEVKDSEDTALIPIE